MNGEWRKVGRNSWRCGKYTIRARKAPKTTPEQYWYYAWTGALLLGRCLTSDEAKALAAEDAGRE